MTLVRSTFVLVLSFTVTLSSGACTQGRRESPADAVRRSPLPDTSTARETAILDSTGDTVLKYKYVLRDSAGLFDPGGYYIPDWLIDVDSLAISHIEIIATWYDYGGELHYERPQVLTPPVVRLSYARAGSEEDARAVTCEHAEASRDTLSVACLASPLGEVFIDGRFVPGTVVGENACTDGYTLVARVVIRRAGRILHSEEHRFSCTQGD